MSFNRIFRNATTAQPAVYTSVIASAGTLAWGMFIAARKVHDGREFREDMSAVTGDSDVVREARFRVYDMDEHLSCRS